MAISRAQLAKELEPGLNALFGMEYSRYENQHAEIFTTESSDRAFEEEVMLSGFGAAPTKSEGSAINFDDANEAYTARYNHETVALAFSITEEAIEDNLYDRLGSRMIVLVRVTLVRWLVQWHTQSKLRLLQFLTMPLRVVLRLVVTALLFVQQTTRLLTAARLRTRQQ
jgi:hypothetical protein